MAVTWHTLRRYFTGIDIATMRELGHPLDNYEYVVQNATALLKRLEDGSMPPPPFKRWPRNQIDDFQEWIDADFPYKPLKGKSRDDGTPNPSDKFPQMVYNFIGLSQALTGFDDLGEDPDLAAMHLNSMRDWVLAYSDKPMKPEQFKCLEGCVEEEKNPSFGDLDPILNALLVEWGKIERDPETDGGRNQEAVNKALTKLALELLKGDRRKDFVGVVKAIIRLWYTGSLPTTNPIKPSLSKNQWVDGLMWRAAQAHPPGYSTEGSYKLSGVKGQDTGNFDLDDPEKKNLYGHWAFEPAPGGAYTGLGNTATHFKTKGA